MQFDDKIAWGILSTGRMAGLFANALQQVDDAVLQAVASRSQGRADEFGARFQVENCYADYQQLLDDPTVDVVYVAAPHSLHAELTRLCLETGKAVLCEKPFTINAAQAEPLIKLARRKNLFLMEAMWTRYVPAVRKLKELLTQEAIGDVQLMLAGGAYQPDFDPDFYLFNKALGGGVLLDAGVYLLSMASMVFGAPTKVLALAELGDSGVDEHDAMLLSHQNGEIANLYVSHRATSAPDMTLMGSRGKIYLAPPIFCPPTLTLSIHGEKDQVFDYSEPGSGYRYEVMEVHRCLREGKLESPAMPLDETLEIMRTMDKVRRQIGLCYSVDSEMGDIVSA